MSFRKKIISATLMSAVSASAFGVTQTPQEQKSYLQMLPEDLYESSVILSSGFDRLSKKQQDELIVAELLSKKMEPLNKDLSIWSTAAAVTFIGVPLLAYNAYQTGLYGYFDSNDLMKNLNKPGASLVMSAAYLGFVLYSSALVPFVGRNFYNALSARFWGRIDDPVQDIENKYIVNKRFMDPAITAQIEKHFKTSRTDETKIARAKEFAEIALAMPKFNKLIDYNKAKIDDIFHGYPEELKSSVERFCLHQVLGQQVTAQGTPRQGKRFPAFFAGVPGSGKTRIAELVAKVLDLPFAKITLEGANISDLVGRPTDSGDPTPGLIVQAMSKVKTQGENAKNMVLFIDEADRVINDSSSEVLPFLLKLLDPECKSFYNPYLGAEVDVSNLTIVLAGNYGIKDEALAKRMQIFDFKGYPTELKRKILWNSNIAFMCSSLSKNGKYTLSIDEFTQEDRDLINTLITMDLDPGFRSIEKILAEFIDYKFMVKYFGQKDMPNFITMMEKSNEQQKKSLFQ